MQLIAMSLFLLSLKGLIAADSQTSAPAANTAGTDAKRIANERFQLGLNYVKAQKWEEARNQFDVVIQNDPNNLLAYQYRGACAFADGAFKLAITDFSNVISRAPTNHEAYLSRANCYIAEKKYSAALADLNRSIELNPTNVLSLNTRASARNAIKEYEDAITDCTTSLRIAPKDSKIHVMRGFAYYKSGKYQKAIRDFTEGSEIDPRNAEAFNQLAWLQATCLDNSIRNGNQAIKAATKACELANWNNPSYLDTLAAAYAESGDFARAVNFQKQAVGAASLDDDLRLAMQKRILLYEKSEKYRE